MQEERNTLDSFPETIDLNQGSFPRNTSMDYLHPWDNMVNPVENRLSNYMLASGDENISCTNGPSNHSPSFGGWDRGESSSSTNNLPDQARSDDSKMRLGWSSTFTACSATDARSEDRSFEPSNISITNYVNNQVAGRSSSVQNYSSTCGSLNANSNHGNVRENNSPVGLGAGPSHARYASGLSETEQIPNFYASSSNIGSSLGSSSSFLENNDASGPFFGTWGSSCKRKALEGTSGQFYPGGSSSSNQPVENMMQHSFSGCYKAPGDLSISSGPLNVSPSNHSEQLNSRSGVGISGVSPAFFPSSSIPRIAQSPATNFSTRSNFEHPDPVPFETPRGSSERHSSVYAAQPPSRPVSSTNSSELRSPFGLPINPTHIPNQSHSMHLNEARGMMLPYSWIGTSSQGGSSSSSFMLPGERGSGAREEANVISSFRNNPEYPMIFPAPGTRNVFQDQIDWSFAPGTSASSRNHFDSRIGSSSSGRASSGAWLPRQNQTSQNHQRLLEVAPWIPFPSIESDSGARRSHFLLLPSASSSSDEAATTSHAQQQSDQRSAAFLMDMPGDDINGRRALAAVEGRHRLIRQVLNAMRRGVHLQAEDYMLVDPFINGFAELHDQHRDMRLDVDNMSYEELLALEERIGNVNTGLNEEKILGSLKQRKFEAIEASKNLEPCCICQEDYIAGDGFGILDCGHEFHTNCIKQWLILKNLCPICKNTALGT